MGISPWVLQMQFRVLPVFPTAFAILGRTTEVIRLVVIVDEDIEIAADEKVALPEFMPEGVDKAHAVALVDFCQMLLNSNEFVYRN